MIADKNKVHTQFPIPLINRLEKHYVSATSLLRPEQRLVKENLERWAGLFTTPSRTQGFRYVEPLVTLCIFFLKCSVLTIK